MGKRSKKARSQTSKPAISPAVSSSMPKAPYLSPSPEIQLTPEVSEQLGRWNLKLSEETGLPPSPKAIFPEQQPLTTKQVVKRMALSPPLTPAQVATQVAMEQRPRPTFQQRLRLLLEAQDLLRILQLQRRQMMRALLQLEMLRPMPMVLISPDESPEFIPHPPLPAVSRGMDLVRDLNLQILQLVEEVTDLLEIPMAWRPWIKHQVLHLEPRTMERRQPFSH